MSDIDLKVKIIRIAFKLELEKMLTDFYKVKEVFQMAGLLFF